MNNFEINKAVAEKLGYLVQEIDDDSPLGMTTSFHNEYPETVWVARTENGKQSEAWWQFCPTLSWEDAGPIIAKNMISLKDELFGNWWLAEKAADNGECQYVVAKFTDENPLKAAMMVFINIPAGY